MSRSATISGVPAAARRPVRGSSVPWQPAPVFRRASTPRRVTPTQFVAIVAVLALIFGGWHWASALRSEEQPRLPLELNVTFQGRPSAGAYLRLFTVASSAAEPVATGRVEKSGRVQWSTQGVPAGDYIVTAVWSRPVRVDGVQQLGRNVIAAECREPTTSPLRLSFAGENESLSLSLSP